MEQFYLEKPSISRKDDVLEYMIDGVRLRDVITEVTVWDRTI